MRLGSAVQAVHEAVSAALYQDLPHIEYTDRDWQVWRSLTPEQQKQSQQDRSLGWTTKTRRPCSDDVEVFMFPQGWGSTALGYGGMGGASMTCAYTVVVSDQIHVCVYFGSGRLAYMLNLNKCSPEGRAQFQQDLYSQNLAARADHVRRYGVT
jgi:hypothetical protein